MMFFDYIEKSFKCFMDLISLKTILSFIFIELDESFVIL